MAIVSRKSAVQPSNLRGRGESYHVLGPEVGSKELKVNLNRINPGTGPGPFHHHSNAINAFIIVEGAAKIRLDDQEVILEPGDAAFFDRGENHSIENAGSDPLTVIELKVPADSDFVIVDQEEPTT
jgi:uncharacterized cupin superfamily protein